MLIALLNESTALTDEAAIKAIAAACDAQLVHHAVPAFGRRVSHVKYYGNKAKVPGDAFPLVLLDNADQAGALGYHDETPDGKAYGRIFVKTVLDNGGSVLSGPLSVAVTVSHEALEAWYDVHCNDWADGGKMAVAKELCDPVEDNSYDIEVAGQAVSVSNFVLDAWFDPNTPKGTKVDYLGKLTKPLQMTKGGYIIWMQDGKVSQTFGDQVPGFKKAAKEFPAARTARRLEDRPIHFEPTTKEPAVPDTPTEPVAVAEEPSEPGEAVQADKTTPAPAQEPEAS